MSSLAEHIDRAVTPCRCSHLQIEHTAMDGMCGICGCPAFRRDGHVYPVGHVVTS